ncbi:MAG: O-antigen ligase family protein [Flavobacteriales bacterium]|nr:O-antigen ligase family protein [Flavobacteriales bacterium]
MKARINVNFDNLIHKLVCLYAFFIPFERVLKVFFSIDTILKPYRIVAILIILSFGLKLFFRWNSNKEIKEDIFLYLLFVYGLIITLFRMLTAKFYLGYLLNDLFQMGLYLAIFIVIRHINLNVKKVFTILKYLTVGIVLNSIYVFYSYYFLFHIRRQGGFMDNPNYLALSLVIAIVLLIMRRSEFKGTFRKILWTILVFFLGYVFTITGSRTGFVLLSVCFLIMFLFFSKKQKWAIFLIFIGLFTFFQIDSLSTYNNSSSLILVRRLKNKANTEDVRIPIWKGTIRAANASNFLGLGVGQFKGRFKEFYKEENNSQIRRMVERDYFFSPHSDYLAILVIYGLPGLIFYILFLALTGRKILYQVRSAIDIDQKTYYQYSLLILTIVVIFGITSESFNSALFWILLSICSTSEVLQVENENEELIQIEE